MDSREVMTKAWVGAWAVDLVDSKVTGVASKATGVVSKVMVVDNKVTVVAKWVAVVVMASREVLGAQEDPQGVSGRVGSTTNTTTMDRRGEGDTAAVDTRQLVAVFSAK